MASPEKQKAIFNDLADAGPVKSFIVVILPIFFALLLVGYCELREPHCQDRKEAELEEKTKQNKAPELAVTYKTSSSAAEQKPVESRAPAKCSTPCHIVNKTLEDPVGLFTAFLVYVVYIQVLMMFRQETWLRRSFKAASTSASAAIGSVNAARQEYISSHRPRMRIKHLWLDKPFQGGDEIMVRLVTVNHGDTAARIIEADVVVHVVPRGGKPPNEPFLGRIPRTPMMILQSGKTLDHSPQNAGIITLSEQGDIYQGSSQLYCFAYVDYIDGSEPPIPRKTSCCRVLDSVRGGALSFTQGAFIKTVDSEMTEYNYAD